ncbi:MAG: TIGR01212 family radical SAM protein [Deltaproteobacteria bacterium]|nr:MAG: TIGR01212 family radical SAM protein [Deltaproteobacteria bacterium]
MSASTRRPGPGWYRRLAPELKRRFGARVHKVTLRARLGCPNRDGTVGRGGCVFCHEDALKPATGPVYGPLVEQLEAGLEAARQRSKAGLAIAYFQDGTATYSSRHELSRLFEQAIDHPRVVALAVGTRPDFLPDDIIGLLSNLARKKPVWVEIGLQSACDRTLALLNRNHSADDFRLAAERCHAAGLEVVAHVILDLPGEGRAEIERTAALLNDLGVEGVKIHNLHVLRDTVLERWWRGGRLKLRGMEAYAELAADFLEMLDERIVVHRLTGEGPARLMLAPDWGRQKQKVLAAIKQRLVERGSHQGSRCRHSER